MSVVALVLLWLDLRGGDFLSFPAIQSNLKGLNSFLACSDLSSADNLCNSLDPDQDQQNVRFDLDPNCLTI